MTEVLVVYGSRLGATRGIAERIGDRLGAGGLDVTLAAAEIEAGIQMVAVEAGQAAQLGDRVDQLAFLPTHPAPGSAPSPAAAHRS